MPFVKSIQIFRLAILFRCSTALQKAVVKITLSVCMGFYVTVYGSFTVMKFILYI